MRRCVAIFAIGSGLLLGLGAQTAQAQNGQRLAGLAGAPAGSGGAEAESQRGWRPASTSEWRRAASESAREAGLPSKWVENLRDMPPDQQERFMQNNEKFQSLAPERQAQIRQNLQKWNNLPPEQQNRIRATERMLENATPEQREHFRNDIVPALAAMPPGQRARVIGHWRRLQGMTPDQQQAALNDPRFMQGLSPDEQATVRDLNSLGAPPPQ